jgi:hypothetical protein
LKSHSLSGLLVLIFLLLLLPQSTEAQSIPVERDHRWSLWGGYSGNSIKFLGKTGNSRTQIFALGYQRSIRSYSPDKTLWYTADIIPYIHFDYPKRDENNRRVSRSGFGFSPVGFALTHSISDLIGPFLQTTGGIIYMEDNFPTDKARSLNFTFDITLGNSFSLNRFALLSFGYKFHHISNAQTGSENPGLDSNFLFLTLSINQ